MRIKFDAAKDEANRDKHGISLGEAAGLHWDAALTVPDRRRPYGEERYIATAPLDGRLHVTVFTPRAGKLRIISLASSACARPTDGRASAMRSKSARARTKLILPTPVEDRRINAGIKADRDTRELTAKDFAEMVPFREMMKRRGRPKAATHRVPVTLRLEPHVVEYFRNGGRGWQTRMNDTLARYVAKHRHEHA